MTDPVLRRVLGVPSWDAAGAVTNPMTASGDMIVGGVAGDPTRLAAGASGFVLSIVAGVPTWTDALSAPIAFGGASGILGTNSPVQVNATVTAVRLNRFGADAVGATMSGVKSRGATIGASAAVAAGDALLALGAHGIAGDNATIAQAGVWLVEVPAGGVAAGAVSGQHSWTSTNLAGANARRMRLTSEGSLIIGDAALPGTNFVTGLAFGTVNGVDPTTTVDLVHVYGSDRAAGARAFSVFQEAAPVVVGGVATHEWPVRINATNYMVQLRQA